MMLFMMVVQQSASMTASTSCRRPTRLIPETPRSRVICPSSPTSLCANFLYVFKAARNRAARAANSALCPALALSLTCRTSNPAGRLARTANDHGPLPLTTSGRRAVVELERPAGLATAHGRLRRGASAPGSGPSQAVGRRLRWNAWSSRRRHPRTSRADLPAVAKVVQSWSAPPSPRRAGPLPLRVGRQRREDPASCAVDELSTDR